MTEVSKPGFLMVGEKIISLGVSGVIVPDVKASWVVEVGASRGMCIEELLYAISGFEVETRRIVQYCWAEGMLMKLVNLPRRALVVR